MGLIGLKGTDGKDRPVRFFHNISQALRFLKEDKATTAAGNNGAINLYIDDNGKYRMSLFRWLVCKDERLYTNLNMVKQTLKEWLLSIK